MEEKEAKDLLAAAMDAVNGSNARLLKSITISNQNLGDLLEVYVIRGTRLAKVISDKRSLNVDDEETQWVLKSITDEDQKAQLERAIMNPDLVGQRKVMLTEFYRIIETRIRPILLMLDAAKLMQKSAV